jgi:hypothetical protein
MRDRHHSDARLTKECGLAGLSDGTSEPRCEENPTNPRIRAERSYGVDSDGWQ